MDGWVSRGNTKYGDRKAEDVVAQVERNTTNMYTSSFCPSKKMDNEVRVWETRNMGYDEEETEGGVERIATFQNGTTGKWATLFLEMEREKVVFVLAEVNVITKEREGPFLVLSGRLVDVMHTSCFVTLRDATWHEISAPRI